MADLIKKIAQTKQELTQQLDKITTLEKLESIRVSFLGRQGILTQLMDELKALSVEQKREAGPAMNQFKQWAQEAYETRKQQLEKATQHAQELKQKYFDVTAYEYQPLQGGVHVYTKIIRQLTDIFVSMGYQVVDGPEIVTQYYNFEALNIPEDHPAREDHDTFWLHQPGMLLRTHASAIQVQEMEKRALPLALFAPGRCYRNEATDASHDFMFMQSEGILIDKKVSIAQLLATATTFLQAIFETKKLDIRVRPGYFPFVEPGLEIDASCPFCTKGCSVCKKTGWIELLGSGLVHPNVLRASGIDPEVYSAFAFGFGIERIAMIKYGINDIRLFRSTKMPVLEQF